MRHLLKLTVISFCLVGLPLTPMTGFSQESFSQEQADKESKDCKSSLKECAGTATVLAPAIATQLKACKALRKCKKECRIVKRECKKEARSDKKTCKQECKDKFKGKELRDCKKSCRQDKRAAKKGCREEKRECKKICRSTFLTTECQVARKAVLGSVVAGVGACGKFVACAAKGAEDDTQ